MKTYVSVDGEHWGYEEEMHARNDALLWEHLDIQAQFEKEMAAQAEAEAAEAKAEAAG